MDATVEIPRKLPLFARLGDEALRAVAGRTVVRTVPEGRILFRRGAPAEGLCVVLEGAIEQEGPRVRIRSVAALESLARQG